MQRPRNKTTIIGGAVVFFVLLLLWGLTAGSNKETAKQGTHPLPAAALTPPEQSSSPSQTVNKAIPAAGTQPAKAAQSEEEAEQPDINTMKQRYDQDPTGARARLGMCRKGMRQDGQGGRHRRFRGGHRWNDQ